MTVRELIAELEDYDDGREVRLAFQLSWPLQYHLGQVTDASDCGLEIVTGAEIGSDEDDDDSFFLAYPDGDDVVAGPFVDRDEAVKALTDRASELGEDGIVYLAEGGQVYSEPYLPGNVSRSLGWR